MKNLTHYYFILKKGGQHLFLQQKKFSKLKLGIILKRVGTEQIWIMTCLELNRNKVIIGDGKRVEQNKLLKIIVFGKNIFPMKRQ